MQSFEWVNPASVEQAVELLSSDDARGPVLAKAGGIDLLDLMKEGIIKPSRLVNLRAIPGLDQVRVDGKQGLELGTLVTLARIANRPGIRRSYGALAEAAGHAATPQVRNAATIGGNLLQRPRCWYFRSEYFHLPEARGDPREGENQYHAIFDNARSPMVHSSTPATALVAYDASVELVGPRGKSRTVAVKDLLLPPDMKRDRDPGRLPQADGAGQLRLAHLQRGGGAPPGARNRPLGGDRDGLGGADSAPGDREREAAHGEAGGRGGEAGGGQGGRGRCDPALQERLQGAGAGGGGEEDDSGGDGVGRARGRACRQPPGRPRRHP